MANHKQMEDRTSLHVHVEREDFETLQKMAKAEGRSLSSLLRRIVRAAVATKEADQ